ncbi:helix-hairpin-helix domain-containing protein [Paraclostridium bifermentans]|nr:helix-hairpin-helix domain-containing protein [Paraclostridium bifermentans]
MKKSAENLIKAIEKSKQNELYRLINGLGIKYIGVKGAKVLAKNFDSLDKIINADAVQLTNLEEFGDIWQTVLLSSLKKKKYDGYK